MKINQKLYDVLKYIALVGLPAVATFIMVVGADDVWNWSHVDQIVKTLTAFDALLGALLLINSAQYTKDQKIASLVTDSHPNDMPLTLDEPKQGVGTSLAPTPAVNVAATPSDPNQPAAGTEPVSPSEAIRNQ